MKQSKSFVWKEVPGGFGSAGSGCSHVMSSNIPTLISPCECRSFAGKASALDRRIELGADCDHAVGRALARPLWHIGMFLCLQPPVVSEVLQVELPARLVLDLPAWPVPRFKYRPAVVTWMRQAA